MRNISAALVLERIQINPQLLDHRSERIRRQLVKNLPMRDFQRFAGYFRTEA